MRDHVDLEFFKKAPEGRLAAIHRDAEGRDTGPVGPKRAIPLVWPSALAAEDDACLSAHGAGSSLPPKFLSSGLVPSRTKAAYSRRRSAGRSAASGWPISAVRRVASGWACMSVRPEEPHRLQGFEEAFRPGVAGLVAGQKLDQPVPGHTG